MATTLTAATRDGLRRGAGELLGTLVIGVTAFLTVVDLFATQAILPSLTVAYGVTPAQMGLAVNASTLGMAVAGLLTALVSPYVDRRRGVTLALALLAIPTALLAAAPDLATFAALRIAQGLCMAAAFTLTLAYLAEQCSAEDQATAFAAYITGNVASNLIGRLISAGVADHLGLAWNFYLFAGLNLAGALLVWLTLKRARPMAMTGPPVTSPLAVWGEHLRNPRLVLAFAIGFCILWAFIGTFTYVNFVLVAEPLAVSPMALGVVYLVFLPSILTTPLAGRAVRLMGTRRAFLAGLGIAALGLPALLAPTLAPVLAGLVLVAVGTFLAQAIATGFVGRAATADRGSASGLYLAAYFTGGIAGTAVLGALFDSAGWPATVAGIAAALVVAGALAALIRPPAAAAMAGARR